MSALDTPEAQDNSVNDAPQDDFPRLRRMVKAGHKARSDWRKEAERAFDFVAGWQWSEEDKKLLNEQKRPAVTFNRTAPIIKAVCGLEVNNRQGIVFLPRKEGDSGPDEARTAAAKWIRDECGAEDEESEAFRDAAICGEGWTETRMDYDDEPDGKVVEERIDPLEMGTNDGACRANYGDARLMYRVRDIDVADAKEMFPTVMPDAINAAWMSLDITPSDGGTGNKKDYPNETRDGLERVGGNLTKCRVVQVQWWERTTVHLVAQEGDAATQEMNDDDYATYSERAKQAGISHEHAVVPQKVYYEAFLGRDGLLPDSKGETKRTLKMGMFQWRCMTGERDRRKKMFYGLVRDMFDPQMWANKWLSQTMQIMNSNAKGGIMAEVDAFVNQRKAEQDWADPTKIVWVKSGAISGAKIKDRISPPLPQGLGDLMQFALSSLRDTTGVNLELLGQADREQAASLEMQRRQSAMTILATLFDNLRRYRKSQGRLLLYFVELLPNGTLIRILEKGQYKYIPLIKNEKAPTYDVIVDEAPSSPDQKQAVWAMITQLMQSGIQLSPQTVIHLLKYSPLPESAVEEIMNDMGMGTQMPPEVLQQKLQQAEQALQVLESKLQQMQNEAATAEDDRNIEMMKLEIEEYKAETIRLQAQWQAGVNLQEALTDAKMTPQPGTPAGADGQPGTPATPPADVQALHQKVDAITNMFQQFMQGAQGGAAPQPAPPPGQQTPPPQDPSAALGQPQ